MTSPDPNPREGRGATPAVASACVAHVMTHPLSLTFLRGQVSYVRQRGFEVHAIASPGPALAAFGQSDAVPVHAVPMTRRITPVADLVSLWRLWRTIRAIRPEIVHAHTPKGGLLGMIAAWLARTPVRIYHIRGLPFVTAAGLRRRLLRATEWISCRLAHRVLAVSHSMRTIAIAERICPPDKIRVFLSGSGNGVDAARRFKPKGNDARLAERARLGIPPDARVVGFVGRLVRDKGVTELATAWRGLREEDHALHLVLAGALEREDPVQADIVASLKADARVHLTGHVQDMPRLYATMDVVALPTYREGFPNVALEAAAMALPIVATRVPGCTDAVDDGHTGTLVPPCDPAALRDALARYLADPALRTAHGNAGRRRVLTEFRPDAIWEATAAEYRELLDARSERHVETRKGTSAAV